MIAGQLKRVIELSELQKENNASNSDNLICFISGKGGTGKSILSLLTALSLSENCYKVLVIDLDLGFPNANILLNHNVQKSLDDYYLKEVSIENTITCLNDNLHIIFGLNENSLTIRNPKIFIKNLITEIGIISKKYNYVIIDNGAGIDELKLTLLQNSSFKVIVTNSEPTSIMDAYALIKIFENACSPSSFLILINNSKDEIEGQEAFQKLQKAVNSFLKSRISLLTIFKENPSLKEYVSEHNLLGFFHDNSNILDTFKASLNIFKICSTAQY
jgi:flagellar biosynthesis protein FlhG